jgi:hypothetical protein
LIGGKLWRIKKLKKFLKQWMDYHLESDWKLSTVAHYLNRGHTLEELRKLSEKDLFYIYLLKE